eukprot:COSAG02_NODE_3004_length_7571_cov_65.586188_6_plen_106_part_00
MRMLLPSGKTRDGMEWNLGMLLFLVWAVERVPPLLSGTLRVYTRSRLAGQWPRADVYPFARGCVAGLLVLLTFPTFEIVVCGKNGVICFIVIHHIQNLPEQKYPH